MSRLMTTLFAATMFALPYPTALGAEVIDVEECRDECREELAACLDACWDADEIASCKVQCSDDATSCRSWCD